MEARVRGSGTRESGGGEGLRECVCVCVLLCGCTDCRVVLSLSRLGSAAS